MIGPLRWENLSWWLSVAVLHTLGRTLFLVGLQNGSFSTVCIFSCFAALGYGFHTKGSDSSSPEKVVFASAVIAGIIALGLHDGNSIQNWVHGSLFVSSVAFWGFAYFTKFRAMNPLQTERLDVSSTMEYYLAVCSAPMLAALFWWFVSPSVEFSVVGSIVVPLRMLSYTQCFLVTIAVVAEEIKARVALRMGQVSTLRFYVGVDLGANLVFLILGSGVTLLDESVSIMGMLILIGSSAAAVAFVSKDLSSKKKSVVQ